MNEKNEYIQTTMSQNYISRSAIIAPQIAKVLEIKGRSIIHPDVQIIAKGNNSSSTTTESDPDQQQQATTSSTVIPIRIGRYCHIGNSTKIVQSQPHQQRQKYYGVDDDQQQLPQQLHAKNIISIGSYTMIGSDCTINSCIPDNNVYIGCNCLLGDHVTIESNVKLYDNCIIESHTYIPPNTTIPPFTRCYNNVILPTIQDSERADDDIDKLRRRRRHIHLCMESISPSVVSIIQERAVATYDTFVSQYNTLKK